MIKKIEKLIRQYRETLSYLFFGVCAGKYYDLFCMFKDWLSRSNI